MTEKTFSNLIVDLNDLPQREPAPSPEVGDERALAWIDEVFGGFWSSEAAAGSTLVERRDGVPIAFATIDARGLTFRWLRGVARERDVGVFGPFGVAPQERGSGLGRRLALAALHALRDRGYARGLIGCVGDQKLIDFYATAVNARVVERFDWPQIIGPPPRTLIMASGSGSNFQAVIDAVEAGTLPIDLAGLLCDKPKARAIERARAAGIPVQVIAWKRSEATREQYDAELLSAARSFDAELILLLGWMHLLSAEFVASFSQLLNLHPAFLPLDPARDAVVMPDGTSIPAFRGPHAVRDALAQNSAWVGATVHRVTAQTDRGPVMARVPMRTRDEEEDAVMERLHTLEHRLIVTAAKRYLFERA